MTELSGNSASSLLSPDQVDSMSQRENLAGLVAVNTSFGPDQAGGEGVTRSS